MSTPYGVLLRGPGDRADSAFQHSMWNDGAHKHAVLFDGIESVSEFVAVLIIQSCQTKHEKVLTLFHWFDLVRLCDKMDDCTKGDTT